MTALQLLNNGLLASASSYVGYNGYNQGDNRIFIWNPYKGLLIATLSSHTNYVTCLEQLNNGLLASGSRDSTIKIWNTTTSSLVATLAGHNNTINNLNILSNGNLASSSVSKGSLYVWDTYTFKLLYKLNGHQDKITDINNLQFNKPRNRLKLVDY